jgi:hypothetical protein
MGNGIKEARGAGESLRLAGFPSLALRGGTRDGKPKLCGWNRSYRFDCPRTIFLIFFLFAPRGVVRLPLGAAFLRAVRFTFLRSALSSIFLVFATEKSSFRQSVCEMTHESHGNGIERRKKAVTGTKEAVRGANEAPVSQSRGPGGKMRNPGGDITMDLPSALGYRAGYERP